MPAEAQFFSRKPKVQLQSNQVPDLIATSRSDSDERKRIAAIEQLRDQDAKAHPDIVPALVDILMSDAKSSVRLEAVNTLARIRPASEMAGRALEIAAHRDDSWRVRWQAKTSLWSYGYRGAGKDGQNMSPNGPNGPTTKEPPLSEGSRIAIDPPGVTPVPLPGTDSIGPRLSPASQPVQGSPVSVPRALPQRNDPNFGTPLPPQKPPQSNRVPVPTTADPPILVPVQ
jgi:hypothetical protein